MHVNGSWKVKKLVPPLQVPLQQVQLQQQRPQQQQLQRQAQRLKFHQQQKLLKQPASSLRNFVIRLILVGCVRWKTSNTHSV